MTKIQITLKVLTKDDAIYSGINRAIIKQLDKKFSIVSRKFTNLIGSYIEKSITASPEYNEIIYGRLRTELGIRDPQQQLDGIIKVIQGSTTVKATKLQERSKQIMGKITIKSVLGDFSDVLGSGLGRYTSERGEDIPWLQWLLFEGDKSVVRNYSIKFGFPKYSRTGDAIMSGNIGQGWGVPSQFAGTLGNNFITKAIDASIGELEQQMVNTFKQGI